MGQYGRPNLALAGLLVLSVPCCMLYLWGRQLLQKQVLGQKGQNTMLAASDPQQG